MIENEWIKYSQNGKMSGFLKKSLQKEEIGIYYSYMSEEKSFLSSRARTFFFVSSMSKLHGVL